MDVGLGIVNALSVCITDDDGHASILDLKGKTLKAPLVKFPKGLEELKKERPDVTRCCRGRT